MIFQKALPGYGGQKKQEKMQTLRHLLLLAALLSSTTLFAQDDPFNGVQAFFSAISAVDHERISRSVTSDFHLLEDGEVWDLDELLEAVGPSQSGRRNYFHVIRAVRSGNSAWISYWNKATFPRGEQVASRAWLESAVLVDEGDAWRLQMLHSTRIDPENLPAEIELSEYRN